MGITNHADINKKEVYISVPRSTTSTALRQLKVELNKIPERADGETVKVYTNKIKAEIIAVTNEDSWEEVNITTRMVTLIARTVLRQLNINHEEINAQYREEVEVPQATLEFERSIQGRDYLPAEWNDYLDRTCSNSSDSEFDDEA